MRKDIKNFLLGALLATVPMSYLVAKSIPTQPKTIEANNVASTVRVEGFLWSSKLTSTKRAELNVLASNDIFSAQQITATPTPTIKPNKSATKPVATNPKPKTQTAVYVVQAQSAPVDVAGIIEKYASEYGVNKDIMIGIAKCESGFRSNAVNGPYAGIYQFVASTWSSNRKAMGLDPDPSLRYNLEESIKTAAFKMSRDGFGAWPVCQQKARVLLSAK